MEEKRDAKLMRCKPLCVYLALIALTTHKWGANEHRGAKQKAPLCTRTPTIPPFGEKRPSSGGAHRAGAASKGQQWQCKRYRCVPVLPRPTFRWGRPSSGRHTSDQAKRRQTVHARTPTPPPFGGGRPSYKSACTVGQGQTHDASEGWVMRGGDGSRRLLEDKNWSSHCRWPNTPGYDSPGRNVSCALSVKKQWWTCH